MLREKRDNEQKGVSESERKKNSAIALYPQFICVILLFCRIHCWASVVDVAVIAAAASDEDCAKFIRQNQHIRFDIFLQMFGVYFLLSQRAS